MTAPMLERCAICDRQTVPRDPIAGAMLDMHRASHEMGRALAASFRTFGPALKMAAQPAEEAQR